MKIVPAVSSQKISNFKIRAHLYGMESDDDAHALSQIIINHS